MNTKKPISPTISFTLQKYQAMSEPRTESALHPLSQPIAKSFSSYVVSGGVVRKIEE